MRSYVDPCSFVVFFNTDGRRRLNPDFVSQLRSHAFEQGESPEPILSQLPLRSRQVQFHEDDHFWQGLRLPYLFWYATLFQIRSWI
ncbi:hypothetical protein [Burkholderia ubonensis]|uniref:hypothetical protein n=1 Tax=Burkholderia ubonensis TaxID=101571 RepID=UPI000A4CFFB5|nr:hypothetical protein [Burkholderia ubonensis]